MTDPVSYEGFLRMQNTTREIILRPAKEDLLSTKVIRLMNPDVGKYYAINAIWKKSISYFILFHRVQLHDSKKQFKVIHQKYEKLISGNHTLDELFSNPVFSFIEIIILIIPLSHCH